MSKFTDKMAKRILAPYMTKILKVAYSLRSLSYSLPFDKWCEKFHEHLKNYDESEDLKEC